MQLDLQLQTPTTPERRLLVAMLERAVFDYFGNQADDQREAASWLFDPLDNDTTFSFAWVCRQLDLDQQAVLQRIRRMKPREEISTQEWWANFASMN